MNPIVVITGSSRGLGKQRAIEFQNAGARVVISSRDADAVKRANDRRNVWRAASVGWLTPSASMGKMESKGI